MKARKKWGERLCEREEKDEREREERDREEKR